MEVRASLRDIIQINGSEGASIRDIIQINGSEGASISNIININGSEGASIRGHNSYLIIEVKGPQIGIYLE